jgi:hypothetical protein
VRGATGCLDHGLEVLDLALDGVGRRVAALAATAAVVGVDGEAIGQLGGERATGAEGAVTEGAVDQDEGRALACLLVGDKGPVG